MEQSTPVHPRTAAASERSLPGARLPLRVGFTSGPASGLASAVDAVDVGGPERARRGPVEELDALVVDRPGDGLPADALRRLCEHARARGLPVIGLRRGGEEPAWAGLADLETGDPGSTEELTAAPAVDISRFNPDLFAPDGIAGFMAALDEQVAPDQLGASFTMLRSATRFDPVTVRTSAEPVDVSLPDGVIAGRELETDAELLEVLHKRLGVLDHPSFHASEFERAGWIAKLCAAGVPVCAAEISDPLRAMLGAELAALIEPLRPRDLADLDRRERASVALRRAALREHSATARWRQIAAAAGLSLPARPKVSVILSTRRESWLEHGIAQVARQTYEPRELVVCLHGDEFAPGTAERVGSLYQAAQQRRGSGHALAGGECKVIRVDGELTLGDALNAGVEASAGELVTKMDDDDYYSTEHLWDLVLALEYSGADLVGKAAEFVYLEEIDVTVRQISHDVDTRMAGGGMMAVKGPLREVGGWPQRSRAEDLYLIRRFTGAGRPIRRIPPHGYILNRHGVDHTWRPQVDYFLFRSERQWRGLGFDVTSIDAPTDPYSRIPEHSVVR
jgi:Glycosyl transferase family 2